MKKLTLNIDEGVLLEGPKANIYPEFCEFINDKIQAFKKEIEDDENVLLEKDDKDKCLEKLGDLSRKLTFIQTMNLSKKSDSIWQSELFGFLSEFEGVINAYFKDGERKSDKLRDELLSEFKNLQNKA